MTTFVTFGEAMLRLGPHDLKRWQQSDGMFEVGPAGAELNVACSLAILGQEVRYVTALPNENPLADMLIAKIQSYGVKTEYIQREPGRLGLIFVETGACQRPGRVHYDRSGSSVSLADAAEYPWDDIFTTADHLHLTGITPALSKEAANATLHGAKTAKDQGMTVSCDLNFRSKLWKWHETKPPHQLAGDTMRAILPHIDLVVANEADLGDVLGLKSDLAEGRIDPSVLAQLAREAAKEFPNLSRIAISMRDSISASHNRWGGLLLDIATDQVHLAPVQKNTYRPYEINPIVDRVGAGDAFAAGLLYALQSEDYRAPERAIAFAVAASCLAHTIPGDVNQSNLSEIITLLEGNTSGRVIR